MVKVHTGVGDGTDRESTTWLWLCLDDGSLGVETWIWLCLDNVSLGVDGKGTL